MKARDKYPDAVKIEMAFAGLDSGGENCIEAPNISVDGKVLGCNATFEDLEKAIKERMNKS